MVLFSWDLVIGYSFIMLCSYVDGCFAKSG